MDSPCHTPYRFPSDNSVPAGIAPGRAAVGMQIRSILADLDIELNHSRVPVNSTWSISNGRTVGASESTPQIVGATWA